MVKFFFTLCTFAFISLATPKELPSNRSHNIFQDVVRSFYNSKAITNVNELLNKNHRAELDEVVQTFNDGVGFKLITIKNGYVQADLGSFEKALAQLDSIIPQQASQIRSAIDGIHKISAREFAASLTKPAVSSRAVQKSMTTLLASTACSSFTSTISGMYSDYSSPIYNSWIGFVDTIGTIGDTYPLFKPVVTLVDQVDGAVTGFVDNMVAETTSTLNEACGGVISFIGNRRDMSEKDLNRINLQNRSVSVTSQFFNLIISAISLVIIYVFILVFGFTLYGMNVLIGPLALFFTVFQ
ncbi:unnamed protein product [Ceutorhynchus assimilis]|uniref:Uncharacterized protein n=1 Tax=Ceutorhynchus assimilis TaxID=467358 RepID=A0A9N9QRP2_9CUCU|nr:unnamed protein product [Ceutorhynchus assimilis]